MKWNKYRLKTTTQASDFVCSILIDLGITGMEVEDNIQLTEEEKKHNLQIIQQICRKMMEQLM